MPTNRIWSVKAFARVYCVCNSNIPTAQYYLTVLVILKKENYLPNTRDHFLGLSKEPSLRDLSLHQVVASQDPVGFLGQLLAFRDQHFRYIHSLRSALPS